MNDIIHWICIEPTSTFSIRVWNCNFSPHYSEIERFTLWIYFPLNFIFGLGCVSVGFCITAKSLLISNFVRFMPNNKHQIQTMKWKYLNMPPYTESLNVSWKSLEFWKLTYLRTVSFIFNRLKSARNDLFIWRKSHGILSMDFLRIANAS